MELGLALNIPLEQLERADERTVLTYVDILESRQRG